MIKLDCLGEMCPHPLVKLKAEIEKGTQIIVLATDHSCTVSSVEDYLAILKLYYKTKEVITGIWEITVYNKKTKS